MSCSGRNVRLHKYLMYFQILLFGIISVIPVANATLPASYKVTKVNVPELKKAAGKHLSPQDAETIEKLVKKEGLGHAPGPPPFTSLENSWFVEDLVTLVKPYLERGQVKRVEGFFKAINVKKLLKGLSAHHARHGSGDVGGVSYVELSIEITDSKEYLVIESFKSAFPPHRYYDGQRHLTHIKAQ